MIKRAGDGVSLVVKICEPHFGDAFSNDVEKAGDSPLGESGPIWGNLSGTAEVSFRLMCLMRRGLFLCPFSRASYFLRRNS